MIFESGLYVHRHSSACMAGWKNHNLFNQAASLVISFISDFQLLETGL